MKQILISIKPKWVAKILSGEKTLEIRKTAPKEWADYFNGKTKKKPEPVTVFIYCTKDGYLHLENEGYWSYSMNEKYTYKRHGKVVAKFTLKDAYAIYTYAITSTIDYLAGRKIDDIWIKHINEHELLERSCLLYGELDAYLKGRVGCAWKIDDLEIFGEPKKISNFGFHYNAEYCNGEGLMVKGRDFVSLQRAPQSWCYVEAEK